MFSIGQIQTSKNSWNGGGGTSDVTCPDGDRRGLDSPAAPAPHLLFFSAFQSGSNSPGKTREDKACEMPTFKPVKSVLRGIQGRGCRGVFLGGEGQTPTLTQRTCENVCACGDFCCFKGEFVDVGWARPWSGPRSTGAVSPGSILAVVRESARCSGFPARFAVSTNSVVFGFYRDLC